jgi:hypothetical protein
MLKLHVRFYTPTQVYTAIVRNLASALIEIDFANHGTPQSQCVSTKLVLNQYDRADCWLHFPGCLLFTPVYTGGRPTFSIR